MNAVYLFLITLFLMTLISLLKIYFGSATYYRGGQDMRGKTVVITGGNTGIGKQTAVDLAKRGAKIILGCRNEKKAKDAVKDIKALTGNEAVEFRHLDLSDLDSVRAFAQSLMSTESHIDVLINNAERGDTDSEDHSVVIQKVRSHSVKSIVSKLGILIGIGNGARHISGPLTKQNFDLVFGTNYLGPFLLTYLLLDSLKSAPERARIINISSLMNWFMWRQLQFDRQVQDSSGMKYPQLSGYKLSKLANIMHARELAIRLKDTNVTANSLHPGLVDTEIFDTYSKFLPLYIVWLVIKCFVRCFGVDAKGGAQTAIFLAVDESIKTTSGKYFDNLKVAKANPLSNNDKACKELWDHSIKMCDLS